MDSFAFIIHPIDTYDVARKFKFMKNWPEKVIEGVMKHLPPVKVSHITGVRSPYNEVEGWFVGCPLTTRQMMTLPEEFVIQKIIKAGKLAEKLGAKIVGLGAFTSVVGDAGITISKNLNIPVTTGNSYTVATAIEGAVKAAEIMGKDIKNAEVVVIGATGSIGKVCAEILARDARFLTLVGRNTQRLESIAEKILRETGLSVRITSNVKNALKKADVIITVTSSVDSVIDAEDLKPGAVVCDVARPRDVSKEVAEKRDDVLIIEGGVVEVPGDVNFNFNFGFPPKTSYACMAETMILALEQRYECFTLGRDLTVEQVEEISRLAKKHGFKLAGFRSFERPVTEEQIERIKENARKNLAKWESKAI
ncbi:saccharopine dehydrogenase NADP-binding domain-containing protein [Thermosediminibacter oceani]|uniref:Shikimate/quinate 5-dehydrogenase n=1 Tax=Thermosediminibacter oceani (strain ATCC BAA-1034 / DSM 16646 / JW/IW-1228P) TaxID=555079 RepID=D9S0D6_THEOJ|nr:saccharopine dehydrogenase NADP-binding domain-containing protein [Thermosediminibacter oceani]ADL08794.1 Shikimate/quinate 5-dehydrogenase [Thermosediminibacter oceani DSM 16646]